MTASAASSSPRCRPSRPRNSTIARSGGSPAASRMRSGRDGRRVPAGLAVEQDGWALAERPDPLAVVGEGVVDGHHRVDLAHPAGLLGLVPGEDPPGHVLVVVRVEDRVDDVVDDDPGAPGAPGGLAELDGDREREDAERVVEVRRRDALAERRPPAADVDGPEPGLHALVDATDEVPEDLGRRLGRRRLVGPAAEDPGGPEPPDPDRAIVLVVRDASAGHRGDLDLPTGLDQAARHAQPARVRGRGVRDQEDGARTAVRTAGGRLGRHAGQERADQPAPRRSTCRGRVSTPCELSTVSTTRSARA